MAVFEQNHWADRTIGDIAAMVPGATSVFRKFGIDFWCAGGRLLAEAARAEGIGIADVEAALDALSDQECAVPALQQTDELIDHIVTRYHETHRRELVELIRLSRTVEAVHAGHAGAPQGLADALHRMAGELEVHMKKEELILFPAMRRCAEGQLNTPLAQMRHDHDDHGAFLQNLKDMTNNFTPPEGACRSWQALYAGLAKLAQDLMEHIHIENNALFPRYEMPPAA